MNISMHCGLYGIEGLMVGGITKMITLSMEFAAQKSLVWR
ncbi:hypothetical protein DOT_5663 [Desulfosporosinus sp. OT]|nr:hypothetical protein DOT_5663 [Desulfosporosinus sp. OT]